MCGIMSQIIQCADICHVTMCTLVENPTGTWPWIGIPISLLGRKVHYSTVSEKKLISKFGQINTHLLPSSIYTKVIVMNNKRSTTVRNR